MRVIPLRPVFPHKTAQSHAGELRQAWCPVDKEVWASICLSTLRSIWLLGFFGVNNKVEIYLLSWSLSSFRDHLFFFFSFLVFRRLKWQISVFGNIDKRGTRQPTLEKKKKGYFENIWTYLNHKSNVYFIFNGFSQEMAIAKA